MHEVILIHATGTTSIYGVYSTLAEADRIARQHRATGYWAAVRVNSK